MNVNVSAPIKNGEAKAEVKLWINSDYYAEDSLLSILTGIFKFAGENKDNTMVLFGHTDTSGEIEPNYYLSELRARAMKSFLDDDPDEFSAIAREKSTVKDYQMILNALTENHGWSCDTGTADNQSGPKTEAGVKNFQAECRPIRPM